MLGRGGGGTSYGIDPASTLAAVPRPAKAYQFIVCWIALACVWAASARSAISCDCATSWCAWRLYDSASAQSWVSVYFCASPAIPAACDFKAPAEAANSPARMFHMAAVFVATTAAFLYGAAAALALAMPAFCAAAT